jgi:hypothetical protein
MTIRKAAAMSTGSLKDINLVADVLRFHPQGEEILRRHFGEKFLKQKNARILSLSTACILRGVGLTSLMEELWRLPPAERADFS